ncbi:unnamed protein product [Staurois parvus]|uniref:NADH dehydrogenase subunit 1 n=1 Tax=Staurois parvus TaxID=386267 RepID=A0ABN9HDN7_9NEOB|nr:unnamed protein product [Staurois parvus]
MHILSLVCIARVFFFLLGECISMLCVLWETRYSECRVLGDQI